MHLSHVAFRFTFTGNCFIRKKIRLRSSNDNYDLSGWLSLHIYIVKWIIETTIKIIQGKKRFLLQLSDYFRGVCFEQNYPPNCFNFPLHFVWGAPICLGVELMNISPQIHYFLFPISQFYTIPAFKM